ncbi:MAG: dTDP-glucose 4,6-dehydratase, partial [Kiritimatiellaeota bacterium]|nr:dTDP-glucose 4,6-dehydratase [Kiritimatiellota bacterium]
RYRFVKMDVCAPELCALVRDIRPDGILHLAAESHVDRSIANPLAFVRTNVLGTANLLHAALDYFRTLPDERKAAFRFQHVSTDEVYGALGATGRFDETSPYHPRSPYSASKAGADHLVRAWGNTYGLPVIVSTGANTYGPCQFPEKLISRVIVNALSGKSLPLYGNGLQTREWLHVEDHAAALWLIHERGSVGETYAIGGDTERTNLAVVQSICRILDELRPTPSGCYADQIAFVADRPGHDVRYALDTGKLRRALGWRPAHAFDAGLRATVRWYLDNEPWWRSLEGSGVSGQGSVHGMPPAAHNRVNCPPLADRPIPNP